jgi:hypothetical protein
LSGGPGQLLWVARKSAKAQKKNSKDGFIMALGNTWNTALRSRLGRCAAVLCLLAVALAALPLLAVRAEAASSTTLSADSIRLLSFDAAQIRSIGNQTSGKCSWYTLRYARTVLDGKTCSGSGMWSNGAVWSAGGYTTYSGNGDLSTCLTKLYSELSAGRPVIVHLQNTHVSGVSKHANRTSTYEYHQTSSGWTQVNYPHIATSSTYGHWVCVVGVRADADPEHLKESDFYALDPARVSVSGALVLTQLLDGTVWLGNSPLKIAA